VGTRGDEDAILETTALGYDVPAVADLELTRNVISAVNSQGKSEKKQDVPQFVRLFLLRQNPS
jgi:hypothetical protein